MPEDVLTRLKTASTTTPEAAADRNAANAATAHKARITKLSQKPIADLHARLDAIKADLTPVPLPYGTSPRAVRSEIDVEDRRMRAAADLAPELRDILAAIQQRQERDAAESATAAQVETERIRAEQEPELAVLRAEQEEMEAVRRENQSVTDAVEEAERLRVAVAKQAAQEAVEAALPGAVERAEAARSGAVVLAPVDVARTLAIAEFSHVTGVVTDPALWTVHEVYGGYRVEAHMWGGIFFVHVDFDPNVDKYTCHLYAASDAQVTGYARAYREEIANTAALGKFFAQYPPIVPS